MLFIPNVCGRSQVAHLTCPGEHNIWFTYQHRYQSYTYFSENTVLTPCKNAPELNVGMCPSTQFLFLSLSAIMGGFLANRPIQLAPERKWAPQCNYIIGLIGEFWEAFCWTQPSSASPSSLRCSSFPLICFEHRKPQRLLLWLHIWFGIKMTHGVGLNYVIYAHHLGVDNISRYYSAGFPPPLTDILVIKSHHSFLSIHFIYPIQFGFLLENTNLIWTDWFHRF